MARLANLARILIGASLVIGGPAEAEPRNKALGTWLMVSAQLDPGGKNLPAYGPAPGSLLVFTADMHVIEVMTDSTTPKFASDARGHGTAEENQAAMAASIGWFGTYTVDENGDLSGDRVEGSTSQTGSVTYARARTSGSSWTATACQRASKGPKGRRSSSLGGAYPEASVHENASVQYRRLHPPLRMRGQDRFLRPRNAATIGEQRKARGARA
jgi:hypothetical protein